MDDYYLPDCCYDYRYDKYEDGIRFNDEDYDLSFDEMEELEYEL